MDSNPTTLGNRAMKKAPKSDSHEDNSRLGHPAPSCTKQRDDWRTTLKKLGAMKPIEDWAEDVENEYQNSQQATQ